MTRPVAWLKHLSSDDRTVLAFALSALTKRKDHPRPDFLSSEKWTRLEEIYDAILSYKESNRGRKRPAA